VTQSELAILMLNRSNISLEEQPLNSIPSMVRSIVSIGLHLGSE